MAKLKSVRFKVSLVIIAIASLGYEKVCVLFNIAALQSAVAAAQSIDNDDSLKLAAKLLQVIFIVSVFHVSQTIQ